MLLKAKETSQHVEMLSYIEQLEVQNHILADSAAQVRAAGRSEKYVEVGEVMMDKDLALVDLKSKVQRLEGRVESLKGALKSNSEERRENLRKI